MKYFKDKFGYRAIFDENTGVSIRGDINGKNAFWKRSGPELLDISITNYCDKCCNFCYRDSNPNGKFMSLQMYERIISEAKEMGVFQVALGGGNPNQHPDFVDFLKITKTNGIVPSYTTNGIGMTDDIYAATKEFAGAVAVSWYEPYDIAMDVIHRCSSLGIPVNIHFILDNNNIPKAYELINSRIVKKVNAIIFLTYKPIGKIKRAILVSSLELQEFISTVASYERCKIGFDSCMISHLIKCQDKIDFDTVDFCEAARFSAFISEEGFMYPCSFMCRESFNGYDILQFGMLSIWQNSKSFVKMREIMNSPKDKCSACLHFTLCHGGCPSFFINC